MAEKIDGKSGKAGRRTPGPKPADARQADRAKLEAQQREAAFTLRVKRKALKGDGVTSNKPKVPSENDRPQMDGGAGGAVKLADLVRAQSAAKSPALRSEPAEKPTGQVLPSTSGGQIGSAGSGQLSAAPANVQRMAARGDWKGVLDALGNALAVK